MENIEATRKLIVNTLRAEAAKKVYQRAVVKVAPASQFTVPVVIVFIPGSLTVHGSNDYFWIAETEEEVVERVTRIAKHATDFGPHFDH